MRDALVSRIPGLSRVIGQQGSLQFALVKATSGSFALKIVGTGLAFALSVILARLLGVAGLGAYSFAMAWVSILGMMATLGFNRLLVREISIYRDRSEWGLMRGLLVRANQIVLLFSVGVALVVAMIAAFFGERTTPEVLYTFWIAMALVPLTALISLRRTAMQGLRRIVSGQVPESILRPVLTIVFIATAYLFLRNSLNAPWAMGLSVLSAAVSFLIGVAMLRRSLPQPVKEAPAVYRTRLWLQGSVSLVMVSTMYIINSRIGAIMLGLMSGPEATGIYTVANRGAELVTFIVVASNTALGPTIASLYAAGEMDRLQRLVTRASRFVFAVSLPVAIGLIVFGHWFLLIFGQEFTRGDAALAVLSIGRLFSAMMCTVGLLLVMTGHQRHAAVGVGIGAGLNVVLNALLIPSLGVEGAAIATTAGLVVWNTLLAVWVYRKLGIYSTALGRIRLRGTEP